MADGEYEMTTSTFSNGGITMILGERLKLRGLEKTPVRVSSFSVGFSKETI
jgi:hypothetical protein